MAKYNFFISYSRKDIELSQILTQQLEEKGYSVFNYMDIEIGKNWATSVKEAISECDCFIPIVTDNFIRSPSAERELDFALELAFSRSKPIFALFYRYDTNSFTPAKLRRMYVSIANQLSELERVVDTIDALYGYSIKRDKLYEQLSEYRNIGNTNREAETLAELILLSVEELSKKTQGEFKKICTEVMRLGEQLLSACNSASFSSSESAQRVEAVMNELYVLLIGKPDSTTLYKFIISDLYACCFAMYVLYQRCYILLDCSAVAGNETDAESYFAFCIVQVSPFINPYRELIAKTDTQQFNEEETEFYVNKPRAIIKERNNAVHGVSFKQRTEQKAISSDDEILQSVAHFMQEGNKLFDTLLKKGLAGDFLKCLQTSYERLKNYCEVVGATDIAADCVDRIIELRNEIDKAQEGTQESEKAENGIKSLLGLTLNNTGNYDVFISFKSEDSDLAEKVYRYCQRNLKVPFWSKRTLPELSKSEYEDAIYAALRNSKHFVVVLSDLDYLEANWVKREMKVFDRAITEGRKPGGNFVFVVTDDVYRKIIACNKACLDERYCGYQIVKMSEYESVLAEYI